ncbi:glutamic acid-rich protein-like [Palaemon carinicauda]|uniref:glutamic acid-rich protein-like n=1 Tax=Palaemon carinicauda TaxID=392227 RepID=UPI0035B64FC7
MDYFLDKDGENSKCETVDVGKGKDFPKEIVYPSSTETEVSSSCSDNNTFKVDEMEVENSSNMNNSPGDQQEAFASSDEQIMRIISESHDDVYSGARVNKNVPVEENESAYESTTDSILKNVIETNIPVGTHEEHEPVTENVETMSTEENSELDEALPALDHTTSDEDSSKSNLSSEVASSQDKIKIPNIFDSFCNENSDVTTSQGSSFSDTSNKEDKEPSDVPENPKSKKLRRNNNFDVNPKNTLDSKEMITDMSIKAMDDARDVSLAKGDSSTEIKEVNLAPDSHEEKEPINKELINQRPYSREEKEPIHKEFLNLRPDSHEEKELISKESIEERTDSHEEKELISKESIEERTDSHEEKVSLHCRETVQETRDNHKDNVLEASEDSHESVGLKIKEDSREDGLGTTEDSPDDDGLETTEDSPDDDGLETTEDSPEGDRLGPTEDSPEDNGFGTIEDSCEGDDLGTTDENDSIVEGEYETEPTAKFPVNEKVSDHEIAEGVDKLHTSDDMDMDFREETEVHREEPEIHTEETVIHTEETKILTEETETHTEETEIHTEETEVHTEETEVHTEETEVHTEEAEVHTEEAEVHTEEAEVHTEEAEVHTEEAEVHTEEMEDSGEETEVHKEETEVHSEEMEVDTKMNVECMASPDKSLELQDNNKRDLTEGEGSIIKKFKAEIDVAKTTFGTGSNFKGKDTKEGEYDKRDARKEEIKSKECNKVTTETTVVLESQAIVSSEEIKNNTVNGLEHEKDTSFQDTKETTQQKSESSKSSDTCMEITKQSRKLEDKVDNSKCDKMNVEECMKRAEDGSQNKVSGPEETLKESSNLESDANGKEQKEARNFDTLISPDNVPEGNQENAGDAYLDYDEESIENISRTIRSFSNEKPTPKTLESKNQKETSVSKRVIIVKTAPNVEKVKRKLEEILERSKGEEDAAIAELQRMKREKTEILNAITTEMEKLKSMLVKGKQG